MTHCTPWEIAVAVILGTWFLFSVLGQVPWSQLAFLRRWDVFGLIPHWSFFAPRPSRFDFHLLYRDVLADGVATAWREIPIVAPLHWSCAVWNPARRSKKALFDAVNALLNDLQTQNIEALYLSVSYLLLLHHVSEQPHFIGAHTTQFMLMGSQGTFTEGAPFGMFLSSLHELEQTLEARFVY
jgi:hypothetical protein